MKKQLPLYALDVLLVAVGCGAALACLCTAFSLTLPGPVLLWAVVGAAVFCLLFRLPRGWLWGCAGLLLVVLAALWQHTPVFASLRQLAARLMDTFIKGYGWLGGYSIDASGPDVGLTPALTLLVLGQTWLSALSLAQWKRAGGAVAAMVLGVAPCFVLTDTPPAVPALVVVMICALSLILTQSIRRRDLRETDVGLLWAGAAATALLALLLALFPYDTYQPPLRWEDLTQQMDQINQQLDNRSNRQAGLSGNPQRVELTKLPRLPEVRTTVLTLTASQSGSLYLRGAVYTGFDGDSWIMETQGDWPAEVLFPLSEGQPDLDFTIETTGRERVIYTPYYTQTIPQDATCAGDACLENTGRLQSYTLRAASRFPGGTADPDYAAYVAQHDLYLPETTRQGVLAWWQAHGAGGDADPETVVQAVSQAAAYSRDPGRPPAGADFCTWFLTDAGEGYCVHFASAATALLRALGYPARYAVGYVCDARAGEPVEVSPIHAHAWVEVFQNGAWQPLEATPQDATEFTGVVPELHPVESAQSTTETVPVTVDNPEASETRFVPETTQAPETIPVGTGQLDPSATEAEQGYSPTPTPSLPRWLWVFPALAALVGLVLLRRLLVLRRFDRRLAAARPNGRIRLLWRSCVHLARLAGQDLPPELETVAKRAAFSQHESSAEEVDLLLQHRARLQTVLRRSKLYKRLYYQFILAVI